MRVLLRRGLFYLITAFAAITINFFLPRMMPGDPIERMLTRFQGKLSPEAVYALRELFGQGDTNLWNQYWQYWGDIFTGDLGVSISAYPSPVSTMILQGLPWTLSLIGICTVLSFIIGVGLGMLVGWRRGSWLDGLVPATTFISSIPYFWFGLIMVYVFAVLLRWFPLSGGYQPGLTPGFSLEFIGSVISYGMLPAITIIVSSIGGWLLGMRNMMVTTLSEDYVLLAQAKGLRTGRVMSTYAGRNAVLPSLASFAMSLGFLVGGSIVTEVVFNYPGLGYTLFQAVQQQDYPLMQGIFLVITITVLVANLVADFAYVMLDPRTRQEARR
ncbi:ABC transporter permease [Microbacterium sp. 179-I 3D3 NHS]|uniref:ABC transporter permease n=1 Tax=unclassified Microbacterium TaxID=2609290 RepID=UPI0039A39E66